MTVDIEALRNAVRERANTVSPRQIAEESGVSHETVYAFIRLGSDIRPNRKTLDSLRRWLTRGAAAPDPGAGRGAERVNHVTGAVTEGYRDMLSRLLAKEPPALPEDNRAMKETLRAVLGRAGHSVLEMLRAKDEAVGALSPADLALVVSTSISFATRIAIETAGALTADEAVALLKGLTSDLVDSLVQVRQAAAANERYTRAPSSVQAPIEQPPPGQPLVGRPVAGTPAPRVAAEEPREGGARHRRTSGGRRG